MDKALSMFRIFDIAFFAPGALLFASLRYSGLWLAEPQEGGSLTTAEGVTRLVVNLGAIYFLGLTAHALCRALKRLLKRFKEESANSYHWYQHVPSGVRGDLATYFWYLRATCWNLACAILLSALIFLKQGTPINWPWFGAIAFIAILLLYLLGCDFGRALKNAASADH